MSVGPLAPLEPLAAVAFPAAARWLADPAINRWLNPEWRERTTTPTTLAIALRNRRNRLWLFRHAGDPAGLVALSDLDAAERTANLWYLLGENALAGRGLTTAAATALIDTAFHDLGLRALQAWAMRPNVPSLRLLARLGFRPAGCLRHAATPDGAPVDRLLFDHLAAERPGA